MKTLAPDPRTQTSNLESESGFTLIELLIVMSIMLILMALAVPQMLKVKKNADQTSAVQTMRTIGSAELSYASSYPGNGFGCPLSVLGGDPKSGAPTAQAAQLLDAQLAATGQKSGYTFTVTCGIQDHHQQPGRLQLGGDLRRAPDRWQNGRQRLLLGREQRHQNRPDRRNQLHPVDPVRRLRAKMFLVEHSCIGTRVKLFQVTHFEGLLELNVRIGRTRRPKRRLFGARSDRRGPKGMVRV